jgi:GntR family transcriptional regulator of arabinose operon
MTKVMDATLSKPPKYRQIHDALKLAIVNGEYTTGARLPSESELLKLYGASRLTVNRALRELQLGGFIERRAGSGSYVSGVPQREGFTFGLLIPGLGNTEIFEPICRGMAEAPLLEQHVLLWGKSPDDPQSVEQTARDWCKQWLARKVSGVFFAPLEHTAQKDAVNGRIADQFRDAGIPVVLIDRDFLDFPGRSHYDLVSIDNRRAGYVVTEHLLSRGCRRLLFMGRVWPAPSCIARSVGFRDALLASGADFAPGLIRHVEPSDQSEIRSIIQEMRPDGIVCSNDYLAACVMRIIEGMSLHVPDDIKLAGFDDVKYAGLLPVPLTTVRQPCHEIGTSAITTMVERFLHPGRPPRDILLNFELVVRASSGGAGDHRDSSTTAGVLN